MVDIYRVSDRQELIVGFPQNITLDTSLSSTALTHLLEVFREFANNYYDYIDSIPDHDHAGNLKTATDRIYQEWANISQAYGQRHLPELKEILEAADNKAQEYYDGFTYPNPKTVPIVYFEKRFAITRYPFTPYALISLPLSQKQNQWQALAHELGHHIFWNSLELDTYRTVHKNLRSTLMRSLSPSSNDYEQFRIDSKLIEIWNHWLEESYADIVGALTAGISFAQSAQELALQDISLEKLSEASHDEIDKHPSSYVRPFIAIETLNWLADHSKLASDDVRKAIYQYTTPLAARWEKIYRAKNSETTVGEVPLARIHASVKDVVAAILEFEWGQLKAQEEIDKNKFLGNLFDCKNWLPPLMKGKVVDDLSLKEILILPEATQIKQAQAQAMVYPEPRQGNPFYQVFQQIKAVTESELKAKGIDEQPINFNKAVLRNLLALDLGDEWGAGNCTCYRYNYVTDQWELCN